MRTVLAVVLAALCGCAMEVSDEDDASVPIAVYDCAGGEVCAASLAEAEDLCDCRCRLPIERIACE